MVGRPAFTDISHSVESINSFRFKNFNFCLSPLDSDEEIEPPQSYRDNMNLRRKSVFAESYETGEEGTAVEKVFVLSSYGLKAVYPFRASLISF